MVDPKTSCEGHRMAVAARPLQSDDVAPRNVRHPDTLMAGQVLRDRRRPSRWQLVGCRHPETAALAENLQLHRAVGERTQPKGDIDALADKIDALIREAEVNGDVGMAILKREDQPAGMQDPESRGAGYPDRAGRRAARALASSILVLPT